MKQIFCYTVADLAPYVNWLYYFHAWGFAPRMATVATLHDCAACRQAWLKGLPAEEQAQGRAALDLMADTQRRMATDGHRWAVRARLGLFRAWSEGEDIVVQTDESGQVRLPLLRQQASRQPDAPLLCLSDFVAPRSVACQYPLELPLTPSDDEADFRRRCASAVGVFATTAEPDGTPAATEAGDHYATMMEQTLLERLAEAAAEKLHEDVRRRIWGYAPQESLTPAELFAEKYTGRRPAVGYPSLPDISLNFDLAQLIDFHAIGISLTENGMMQPAASVSGLMLAHPATRHFAVGPVGEDQLADYARRRGRPVEEVRRFLRQTQN